MTTHCPVEFPATREDPGYGCENEVDNEGDLCPEHEADDRSEYDRERHMEDERDDARYDR